MECNLAWHLMGNGTGRAAFNGRAGAESAAQHSAAGLPGEGAPLLPASGPINHAMHRPLLFVSHLHVNAAGQACL